MVSIMKTYIFHSGTIFVIGAQTYVGQPFLYNVTHPTMKDASFSLQVLHTYRVLITC